jgi:hypothetical protein
VAAKKRAGKKQAARKKAAGSRGTGQMGSQDTTSRVARALIRGMKSVDPESVTRVEDGRLIRTAGKALMGSSVTPPKAKARKPFMRKDPRPARKKKPLPPPSRRSMDELKKTRKTRR